MNTKNIKEGEKNITNSFVCTIFMEEREHVHDSSLEEDEEIRYIPFDGEHRLKDIMGMMEDMLSEPYSIFTYRFFVMNWPQLSFIVCDVDIPIYMHILTYSSPPSMVIFIFSYFHMVLVGWSHVRFYDQKGDERELMCGCCHL
jgi:hypothetical protein